MIVPALMPYLTDCEPITRLAYDWMQQNKRPGMTDAQLRKEWISYKESMTKTDMPAEEEDDDVTSDEATCSLVRTQAIFALAKLAESNREAVASILVPIYFNKVHRFF